MGTLFPGNKITIAGRIERVACVLGAAARKQWVNDGNIQRSHKIAL